VLLRTWNVHHFCPTSNKSAIKKDMKHTNNIYNAWCSKCTTFVFLILKKLKIWSDIFMEAGIQYYYTRVILSGSCLRGSVQGTKINSLSSNFFLCWERTIVPTILRTTNFSRNIILIVRSIEGNLVAPTKYSYSKLLLYLILNCYDVIWNPTVQIVDHTKYQRGKELWWF
jgi:hypothetical protein